MLLADDLEAQAHPRLELGFRDRQPDQRAPRAVAKGQACRVRANLRDDMAGIEGRGARRGFRPCRTARGQIGCGRCLVAQTEAQAQDIR